MKIFSKLFLLLCFFLVPAEAYAFPEHPASFKLSNDGAHQLGEAYGMRAFLLNASGGYERGYRGFQNYLKNSNYNGCYVQESWQNGSFFQQRQYAYIGITAPLDQLLKLDKNQLNEAAVHFAEQAYAVCKSYLGTPTATVTRGSVEFKGGIFVMPSELNKFDPKTALFRGEFTTAGPWLKNQRRFQVGSQARISETRIVTSSFRNVNRIRAQLNLPQTKNFNAKISNEDQMTFEEALFNFYNYCNKPASKDNSDILVDGKKYPRISPSEMCLVQTNISRFLKAYDQCSLDPKCDSKAPNVNNMIEQYVVPSLAILNANLLFSIENLPDDTERRAQELGRIYKTFIVANDGITIFNKRVLPTDQHLSNPDRSRRDPAGYKLRSYALSHYVSLSNAYLLKRAPNAYNRRKSVVNNQRRLSDSQRTDQKFALADQTFTPDNLEIRMKDYKPNTQEKALRLGFELELWVMTSPMLDHELRRRNQNYAAIKQERRRQAQMNQALLPLAVIAGTAILAITSGGKIADSGPSADIRKSTEWAPDKPISTLGFTPNDFLLRNRIPDGF